MFRLACFVIVLCLPIVANAQSGSAGGVKATYGSSGATASQSSAGGVKAQQVGLFGRMQARRNARMESRNQSQSYGSNGGTRSACGPDGCPITSSNGMTCNQTVQCPSCGHQFQCPCVCDTPASTKVTGCGCCDKCTGPPNCKCGCPNCTCNKKTGEEPLNPDRPDGFKASKKSTPIRYSHSELAQK